MRGTLVGVWISLFFTGVAAAQGAPEGSTDVANETTTGADVSQPAPETQVVETDAAPASEGAGLDHPRPAPAASEPVVAHDEVPPPPADEPLDAAAEVFVGVTPSVGVGGLAGAAGLGGLASLALTGGADFVFAADRRTFLGFGLQLNYSQLEGSTTSGSVRVPLIAQVYLDDPRRGQATPTLRIVPSFYWAELTTSSSSTFQYVGGGLTVGVGITWFVLDFLAIRILGEAGANVAVTYDGPSGTTVNGFVAADVGVVARL